MSDESCIPGDIPPKCSSRAGAAEVGSLRDRRLGDLAEAQYGIVTRGQLRELGVPARTIGEWIERGRLRRLHQGVYAVGHRALKQDGLLLAAILACGSGAVLSHRSAGHLWGLLPSPPSFPEVTRPRSSRKRPGIIVRRSVLPRDEVTIVDGIGVTSPFRTIFDLAGTLPTMRQLERAMNEAEVRELRDRVSLPTLLERYPRRRGSRWLRALLASKEPGGITRNDFEELFVAFLDEHGLPRPRLNSTLALRGRFFEPDCMWREQRLVVELDGRAVHGTEQAFESDRQRDRILLAEGWRWARVTWRQLRDEPAAVADDLRAALYP
jgi:predicted transcriptional regulator of viral defense system